MKQTLIRAALLLSTLAFLSPAHAAEWVEIGTPNYRVVGDRNEADLRRIAERLEIVRAVLEQQIGTLPQAPKDKRLSVVVVPDADAVLSLSNSGNNEVMGFVRYGADGPVAITPAKTVTAGDVSSQYVLLDLAARLAVAQKLGRGAPGWLSAGWAELSANASFARPGYVSFGELSPWRRPESTELRWTNLAALLDGSADKSPQYYVAGQGMMLVHYLLFTPARRGQLGTYTAAIRAGRPAAEAAQAFGDVEKLRAELIDYDERNGLPFRWVKRPVLTIAFEKRSMSDAEGEALIARIKPR